MCIAAQNFLFIYLNVCNCIYLFIYLFIYLYLFLFQKNMRNFLTFTKSIELNNECG